MTIAPPKPNQPIEQESRSMSLTLKPLQLFKSIWFRLRVNSLPDRKYIRDEMLPAIARTNPGNVLLVGDVCEVATLIPGMKFDVILANGLLGFGIDSESDITRFTAAMANVLVPQGFLMLGWDADRTADPKSNVDIVRLFQHAEFAGLPARQSFVGCAGFDHVFDWFQKISGYGVVSTCQ